MEQVASTIPGSQPIARKEGWFVPGALPVAIIAIIAALANTYFTLWAEDIPFSGRPAYSSADLTVWEYFGPPLTFLFFGAATFGLACALMPKRNLDKNAAYISLVMLCFYGYCSCFMWFNLPWEHSQVLGYLGFQGIFNVIAAIHPFCMPVYYLILLSVSRIICRWRKVQALPDKARLTVISNFAGILVVSFSAWFAMYGFFYILPHAYLIPPVAERTAIYRATHPN
jgi:hypothetical protein